MITDYIPQRPPIVMIDTIIAATTDTIQTALTIRPDNWFVRDGVFEEAGIIEHIAQSTAAMEGYNAKKQNQQPKIGFIGEVKDFCCNAWYAGGSPAAKMPQVGDTITTQIETLLQMQGITLIKATTRSNDQIIASCQMKIFLQE